jgi:hypothetical protein
VFQITPPRAFRYDTLVIAVGSVTNDFGTPGASQYAVPLETPVQAMRFNRRLVNADESPTVIDGIRPRKSGSQLTPRWREMDSNFRFRASSDYAGVGVLRSTWAVLTLRRRDPDWNATKRRRDSERRASTAAE